GSWSGRSVIASYCAMSGCRRVDVLWQGVLRDLDQTGERRGVVDGELGEHAAIDLDAGQVQTLDEAVVGHAVGAGGSVDPLDPELTEVALALQARALAAVPAGLLEDLPTLLLGVDRPLHACHVILLRS